MNMKTIPTMLIFNLIFPPHKIAVQLNDPMIVLTLSGSMSEISSKAWGGAKKNIYEKHRHNNFGPIVA